MDPDRPHARDHAERVVSLPGEELRKRADTLSASHPSSPRYIDAVTLRPEAARHEATKHDPTKHEAAKPEAAKPEAAKPEAATHGGLAERMLREVRLQADSRDLPSARDVIRNVERAQADPRKLADYSMNPSHPKNNGKSSAWSAVGYDISSSAQRRQDAAQLGQLISRDLLPDGRVAAARQTPDGTDYRVINGFIGPNGRHGTLVTCWREPRGDLAGPRLVTTWLAVHPEGRR